MQRDSDKGPLGPESSPAQPKSRFTSPLVINSASRRRSLFVRPKSTGDELLARENGGDQAQSLGIASSDPNLDSPNQSKIPRFSQQRLSQARPIFSLSDAYRMAEEEEAAAARGSPSPAPRAWRSRPPPIDGKLQKAPSPASPASKRRTARANKPGEVRREDTASSVDSLGSQSRPSGDASGSDFDEKLRQHALEQTPDNSPRLGTSRFTKSRLGMKISETARELVKKSSRNSLDGDSPSQSGKASPSGGWLSRRLSSKKSEASGQPRAQGLSTSEHDLKLAQDAMFPSTGEIVNRPATVPPDFQTPEKSFAWEADADFTAGDLLVSDSPPVVIGRSNTKIDEIRALEAVVIRPISRTPPPQSRNTRIDDIRALEMETALRFKDANSTLAGQGDGTKESQAEKEDKIKPAWQPSSSVSPKVDEHRAREIQKLSRRALATARLDEIRERQAGKQQSRSPTPELAKKSSKDPVRSLSPDDKGSQMKVPETANDAENAPLDEAVVLDAFTDEKATKGDNIGANHGAGDEEALSRPRPPPTRRDSRELLRKLALATSTSPVPEHQPVPLNNAAHHDTEPEQTAFKTKKASGAKSDARLTVGFAGLSRDSSAESLLDKRSSFAHSDSDPIERIEGEMQLFAPMENHSERGSIRAPSPPSTPGSEEEARDVEETPRPMRIDPLTQPTPRVIGAFVDTPATVKILKFGGAAAPADPGTNQTTGVSASSDGPPVATDLDAVGKNIGADSALGANPIHPRGRKSTTGLLSRNSRLSLSAKSDRMPGRSSSASSRRRAKSLSRTRPPLVNSVRPPTVKDDLFEIKRANQFDDSTLDDLADLLSSQDQGDVAQSSSNIKTEPDLPGLSESQILDRMSKSLETGLLGIRAAKQGIERLEDKVSHAETKETQTDAKHASHTVHGERAGGGKDAPCAICDGHPTAERHLVTYVQLPIPPLWHTQPTFRFTLLGLTLFLLSLWYIAETSMCQVYCRPQICYPGLPCTWSPDDPHWGYAIPMKLDQWVTGGIGRELVNKARPEISDWVADMWDAATGSDITNIDLSRYNWEQRRRHRRRLTKRGLRKPAEERPEDKAKFSAWRATRLAMEKVLALREMGYTVGDEDESMAKDEAL